MRQTIGYLILAGLVLASCQSSQSWSINNFKPSRQAHRVGVRLPEFLPNRTETWAPILKEIVREHSRLTLADQAVEFYLWVSVDTDDRSSIINLSLCEPGGRVLALISSESSEFADRQSGRIIPDGIEAIKKEIKDLLGQLFPEESLEAGGKK